MNRANSTLGRPSLPSRWTRHLKVATLEIAVSTNPRSWKGINRQDCFRPTELVGGCRFEEGQVNLLWRSNS